MKIDLLQSKKAEKEYFVVEFNINDDIDLSGIEKKEIISSGETVQWKIHISELKDFWNIFKNVIIPSSEILQYAIFAGIIDSNIDDNNIIVLGEENIKPLEMLSDKKGYKEQYNKLMYHQKIGSTRILQKSALLVADMMGLGKTLTALYGLVVDPSVHKTLIVCPSTMKYVWHQEIRNWFPDKKISVIDGDVKKRFQQYAANVDFVIVSYDLIRRTEDKAIIDFLIANGSYEYATIKNKNSFLNLPIYNDMNIDGNEYHYDIRWEVKKSKKQIEEKHLSLDYTGEILFKKEQSALKFDAIILDEAHHIKTPTSEQTKTIHSFIKIPKRVLLTGTPIMNNVEELWSLLYFINPYKFPNYWAFRNKYCVIKEITTKDGRKIKLIVGYKNLDYLQKQLSEIMLRRNKSDTLKDLPPKTYETRYIDLSGEQWKLYNDFKEETVVWIEESEKEIQVHQALDKLLRLKQVAITPELFGGSQKSSKLDELEEIVKEITSNNQKVIVFSQFKKATDIIVTRLKKNGHKNISYISGDVPMKISEKALKEGKTDRMEEIRKFQEDDDCKVFVGVIDACKEGITLTAATYVIFVDKKWTPADNEQAADRAHRKGQKNPVTIISLVAKDTIEEYIESKLKEKGDLFEQVIGGTVKHQNTLKEIREILKKKKGN